MMIAERLKSARKRRGWSQRELADAVGISVQAVSQWETGKTVPSFGRLVEVANHLQIDVNWMTGVAPNASNSDPVAPLSTRIYGDHVPVVDLQSALLFSAGSFVRDSDIPADLPTVAPSIQALGRLFGVQVDADVPEHAIKRNDVLIFDTAAQSEYGDIVINQFIRTGQGGNLEIRISLLRQVGIDPKDGLPLGEMVPLIRPDNTSASTVREGLMGPLFGTMVQLIRFPRDAK